MTLPRRTFLQLAARGVALVCVGGFGRAAWAQTARTIRIIVPFPPGGAADFLARLLAEQVSRVHGVTVLIENRPGAGSVVGTDAARAQPGTLTLAASGPASPFQIGFEVLKRAADVNITFVPFPGAAPVVNALLGGHVTAMLTTYS